MPLFTKGARTVAFLDVPGVCGEEVVDVFRRSGWRVSLHSSRVPSSDVGVVPPELCPPQHYHAALFEALVRPAVVDAAFMIVRHPLERFRRVYAEHSTSPSDGAPGHVASWARKAFEIYEQDPFVLQNALRPQVEFAVEGVEVYRIEDGLGPVLRRLDADLSLGLDLSVVPGEYSVEAATLRPEAVDLGEAAELVRGAYADDLAAFEYGSAPAASAAETLAPEPVVEADQPLTDDEIIAGAHNDLTTYDQFLRAFDAQPGFAFCKINHGFWEVLADAYAAFGSPVPEEKWPEADQLTGRTGLFQTGFIPELTSLLQRAAAEDDPAFHIGLELAAWPDDNRVAGTPLRPERSVPVLREFVEAFRRRSDGLVLKRACIDGRIGELFGRLAEVPVLVVGPEYIGSIRAVAGLRHAAFLPIHPSGARLHRREIEEAIAGWLADNPGSGRTVLLQAGTLAPYLVMRLRERFDDVRLVDAGLALSITTKDDLVGRPWYIVHRAGMAATYRELTGDASLPPVERLPLVEQEVEAAAAAFPQVGDVDAEGVVSFVERKDVDMVRIAQLLTVSEHYNRWANRGPLWHALSSAYQRYFHRVSGKTVVPVSNGGMALEAMAQLKAMRAGRPLRWVVSAFGFHNTGRGAVFADAQKVDCDETGLFSLDELARLDPASYDGIVVTNPYGIVQDFSAFAAWAEATGKHLLIDNAAGVSRQVPDVAWQAFSLHHTKPFGLGEGGLALVPEQDVEDYLALLEYRPMPDGQTPYWLNNGKLSEFACAGHLMRLETVPEWEPLYQLQILRVTSVAAEAGLKPLIPVAPLNDSAWSQWQGWTPVMSVPFLSPHETSLDGDTGRVRFGKYYKPLAPTPRAQYIYDHVINVPSHPGMRDVTRLELLAALRAVTA